MPKRNKNNSRKKDDDKKEADKEKVSGKKILNVLDKMVGKCKKKILESLKIHQIYCCFS